MFLSHIRVRGYKCLEDVDLALTPIHVLIGPCESGKTCLLEALAAFYGRLKTPATQWFPPCVNPRDLITFGNAVPTIDLAGQWSERPAKGKSPLVSAGYGYSIIVPTTGANFGLTDQWVRPRASSDPASGLSRVAFPFPFSGGSGKPEGPAVQAAFRETVQKMLQPTPIYRFDPRRLAEPAQFDHPGSRPMAADGHGLPVLLDEIAERQPAEFAEIQAQFSRIVPRYRKFILQPRTLLVKKKPLRGRRPITVEVPGRALVFETCSGRMLAAEEISPGVLLLLALLTLAHLPEPPTLLLIESIEQHLYFQWLGELIQSLRHAVSAVAGRPSSQVIFTTHSPAVLNFFRPEEATLFARPSDVPDGPVTARPLQAMVKVRHRMAGGKARLGDLWGEFEV